MPCTFPCRLTQRAVRVALVALVSTSIAGCKREQPGTLSMESPEWERFRWMVATHDSLQEELDRMKGDHPETAGLLTRRDELLNQFEDAEAQGDVFASNPDLVTQALVADRRAASLWTAMQEGVPALPEPLDLTGLGMDDLHLVEMAVRTSRPFRQDLFLPIAKARLDLAPDEDTRRAARLDLLLAMVAQAPGGFQPGTGDLSLAKELASDDVLELAGGLGRGRIFRSLALGYLQAGEDEEARRYALKAVEGFREAMEDGGDDLFLSRITSVLSPLFQPRENEGGAAETTSWIEDIQAFLPESISWAAVQASMDGELARARAAVGGPAPEWTEHLWIGSEPLSVASLRGKVALVDFFAIWCGPCISQFPHFAHWQEEYGSQGLAIVGLTQWQGGYLGRPLDEAEELQFLRDDFVPNRGVTWPVGVEKSGKATWAKYGVGPIPHTVLLDRDGKVAMVHTGSSDMAVLEGKIQELLALSEKGGTP